MSLKFNLESPVEISGINNAKLEDLLRILEIHIRFDGCDIERVRYQDEVLHLYPPENSQMTLGEEFQVHSIDDDGKERPLIVTPFFETHHKRTYSSLRISIGDTNYALHRISKAPLRHT